MKQVVEHLILCSLIWLSVTAWSQTPPVPFMVNYQGKLLDGNANPLATADYKLTFRIYDQAQGGQLIWGPQIFDNLVGETGHGVKAGVVEGRFNLILGSKDTNGVSIDTAFTSGSSRFLEITVEDNLPILPRQQILASPYSFQAAIAGTASSVDGSAVTSGTISDARLSSNVALRSGNTFSGDQTVYGSVIATSFVGDGAIPIGGIIMWSGSTVPDGWALCNGSTVNGRTTPNLSGRFVLASGSGTGLTPRTINQTGGAETQTLSTSQMPSHYHSVNPPSTSSASGGSHNHDVMGYYGTGIGGASGATGDVALYNSDGNWVWRLDWTSTEGSHQHVVDIAAFNSASSGGGAAHDNMPPYYVLAFIMRVR